MHSLASSNYLVCITLNSVYNPQVDNQVCNLFVKSIGGRGFLFEDRMYIVMVETNLIIYMILFINPKQIESVLCR